MLWLQGGEVFVDILPGEGEELIIGGYSVEKSNANYVEQFGSWDYWIVKTGSSNLIKGTAFYDYNSNGIKDGSDRNADILIKSTKPGMSWASKVTNGVFTHSVDTGTITTSPKTSVLYYNIVPSSKQSVFTTYLNVVSVAFALQPIPGKRDYSISAFPVTPARPGFEVGYVVRVSNIGTDTLTNATAKLVKDNRLDYISVTPAPNAIAGDTISWNISQLLPGDWFLINVTTKLRVMPPFGILSLSADIDSIGDIVPANNRSVIIHSIGGSYDPNDKREVHGDTLYKHRYDAGDY